MPTTWRILTPIPQLRLTQAEAPPQKSTVFPLGQHLAFCPMTPYLYRSLVNGVKDRFAERLPKDEQTFNDLILLLQEAGSVFWAEVQSPLSPNKAPLMVGSLYSFVADVVLQRLFDSLLLFEDVPKPFRRFLWFCTSGEPTGEKIETSKMLDPDWNCWDWEVKYAEPIQADHMIIALQKLWNKLSPVLGIDQLNCTFTDKKKQDIYNEAGRENRTRKAEEIAKARYGPDATLVEPESTDVVSEAPDDQQANMKSPIRISMKQSLKWFLEGYMNKYMDEIKELTRKQFKEPSGRRFIRAFQIFSNACRAENPHKFIALMTCLETVFCTTTRKVKAQLASRVAWLLNPVDLDKRKQMFGHVKNLYDVRSQVVHGQKYGIAQIENSVHDLAHLVRQVFTKVLVDDTAYDLLFDKDQSRWDGYLNALSLGAT